MSILSAPHFHNEEAAFERLEQIVWPNGPVCPKCGNCDGNRINRVTGKTARMGLRRCLECKRQFTVKVGTVFESAHVPLHKWFQAAHLMASSKKGISAHQLHRTLQVTYKTAWFMAHRLREAMATGELNPFGTAGTIVEVDETFIGNDRTIKPKGQKKGRGYHHKHKVLALVDRSAGTARSMVVDDLKADTLAPIVRANVAREAMLMTDEAAYYTKVGREFAGHEIVRHNAGEYGRGEFHTNTIEGYFSIFKRGMKGVYQHCAKKHLHRYLAEFDFRYNNRVALGVGDVERSDRALAGIVGKRLTYRDSSAW
jgi:transposase-like protein